MKGLVEKAVNRLKKRQITIDKLLDSEEIHLKGKNGNLTWKLDVMYQRKDCSLGFASCKQSGGIGTFPMHVHKDSAEYLICVRGSVLFSMEDGIQRILNEGDCASIPPNREHSTKALDDDTKLVYVCVPHDPAIPSM